MPTQDPIDRLLSQLMTSGLQIKDNPLFQVISQLIKYLRELQVNTEGQITIINTGTGTNSNATYITFTNENALLPFARRLAAGTNITFDISTPGVLIINASGGGSTGDDYVIMTDGFEPPAIMSDGFGNGIYVMYTP